MKKHNILKHAVVILLSDHGVSLGLRGDRIISLKNYIGNKSKTTSSVQLKIHKIPNYYPIETNWENVSIDQKIPFLQKINDIVFKQDNRVIKSNIYFSNETSTILLANSEGRIAFDYQPMGQIIVTCTAEENGRREQNYYNIACRKGNSGVGRGPGKCHRHI